MPPSIEPVAPRAEPDPDVLAALEAAAAEGGHVERCETHAAIVIVGPRHAFKIKRPVRFDYLDFSSLARREAACRRELEINRTNAPDLYLDVVALTRAADGAVRLGGDGDVVEWAVRMRSFREADVLIHRVEASPLPLTTAHALARAVHAAHTRAAVATVDDADRRFAAVVTATDRGLADCGSALDLDAIGAFRAACDTHLQRCAPLLRVRGEAGFVRRCHGDLHLGNIVLVDGAPVLFDALEFDEALATIDTLYDLAFLLMDLEHRGARTAANAVLSRYLWHSACDSDLDALAALPLFLAERAAVRALVAAQRAAQRPEGGGEQEARAARAYLDRARVTLASPATPVLVAVGGLSGTGKSTLAASLAPDLGRAPGAVHLRSDLERKALAGVGDMDRLPPHSYTPAAAAAVYARLEHRAARVLEAGHAVIVDAVFSTPEERRAIEAVATGRGAAFHGLWLDADPAILRQRVSTRRGDASDATADVVDAQIARGSGPMAWHRLDAGGTAEATAAAARRILEATLPPAGNPGGGHLSP